MLATVAVAITLAVVMAGTELGKPVARPTEVEEDPDTVIVDVVRYTSGTVSVVVTVVKLLLPATVEPAHCPVEQTTGTVRTVEYGMTVLGAAVLAGAAPELAGALVTLMTTVVETG